MTIGNAIDACAKKAGLNDVQVAAAVGTSESTVGRWRSEQTQPRHEHYLKLVKLFPELPSMVGAAA